jgi:hypothetical protein
VKLESRAPPEFGSRLVPIIAAGAVVERAAASRPGCGNVSPGRRPDGRSRLSSASSKSTIRRFDSKEDGEDRRRDDLDEEREDIRSLVVEKESLAADGKNATILLRSLDMPRSNNTVAPAPAR